MDMTAIFCMVVLIVVVFLLIVASHMSAPGTQPLIKAIAGLTALLKTTNVETLHRDNLATVKAIETANRDSERRHRELLATLNAQTVAIIAALEKLSIAPVQSVQNNILNTPTREKLSERLIACADWIVANKAQDKSVRAVAKGAGVSIGTAQAAIKLVRSEKQ